MLINRIQEVEGGEGREEGEYDQEYRTASELFDMMAKNHSFDGSEADALTPSDLVLLYKNLDLGTQLMSKELQVKKPNQHVESVVHKEGDDSDSELSEIYSNEDLRDVVLFNNEQIDLINNPPSLEHILCQKIGDLKLETAEHSGPYDKYFLLKDPYIREKLNNINNFNDANFKMIETVFPSSLLDYICCKRLEDNFSFYMDSVIRYVIHTIEQLKRISNGDFLTEKAKEKWREVKDAHGTNCLNFLCTSKSIPIQIERKKTTQISKRRNIMRSEIDIRSLSKLLEKKIVIEIPRLLNGSFTLFSKRCDDNLFITCKKEAEKEEEQRFELVLKLDKSESGMISSKISSIKILQTSQITNQLESSAVKPLALTYVISDEGNESDKTVIEEDPAPSEDIVSNSMQADSCTASDSCQGSATNSYQKEIIDSMSMSVIETQELAAYTIIDDSDISLDNSLNSSSKDLEPITISSPEELRLIVQKLEVEKKLPEEIWQEEPNRKKITGRIRIKSPYENKSTVMEEKRRKKLLEIRQRREIRKQAHAENMKICKQKYGKPHSTNSVTKLSITNKSFYNSIYGQASLYSDKMKKIKNNNDELDSSSKLHIDLTAEQNGNLKEFTEKDHRKYTDRTFFLDDTISDVMIRQQNEKDAKDKTSVTPSIIPNIVIQVIEKDCPTEDLLVDHKFDDKLLVDIDPPNLQNITDSIQAKLNSAKSSTVLAPFNSPKNSNANDRKAEESKKVTTVEFKESIEKIYDLINRIDNKNGKENLRYFEDDESSIPPASEGAESGNCYLGSPTLNSKSLTRVHQNRNSNKQSLETIMPINMPISHKTPGINRAQMVRLDGDNLRNDRKKKIKLKNNFDSENPLKAISMLIREFDDVAKPKSAQGKQPKISQSAHHNTHSTFRSPRRSPTKMEIRMNENFSPIERSGRKLNERRPRVSILAEGLKTNEAMLAHTDKRYRRKVSDVIEQAKEARGEAVRGPCVITSRLNLLAQPKRSYVQAHDEQQKSKARQSFMPERPLRPIHHLKATSQQDKTAIASPNMRNRQKRLEAVHELKRPPNVRPIERVEKPVQPASSGPEMRRSEVSAIKHRYMQESEIMNKKMAIFNAFNNENGRSPSPPEVRKASSKRTKPFNPQNIETAIGAATKQSEDTKPRQISALNDVVNSLLNYKAFQLENVSESSEPCHVISEGTTSSLEVASKNGSSVFDMDVFGDINVVTAIGCNNSSDTLSSNKDPKALKPEKNIQSLHEFSFENRIEGSSLINYKNGHFPYEKNELAPKSILRKTLMLQSNDACSLFVNPSLSHHVKITTSKSDDASGLREMSVLSKSKLGWAFPTIPVQIATVGFAFPQYNFMTNPLNRTFSLAKINNNDVTPEVEDTLKRIVNIDKTSQCFKGPSQSVLHNVSKSNSAIIISVESENDVYFDKADNKTPPKISIVNYSDQMLEFNKQTCPDDSNEKRTKTVASDCSNIQNVKKVEKDTTSSMDMLVSVLNEIKKITTRQTYIANPFSVSKNTNADSKNTQNKNNLMREENYSIDNPSITILKNCDKHASNSSTISDYVTNCEVMVDKYDNDSLNLYDENVIMPVLVDKEVNADIKDKIVVNNSDACSQCFPTVVSESTAVTQSLYGYSSDPSRASILSVDFRTTSNYSLQTPKIVELEDIETRSTNVVESKQKEADEISVFQKFILNSDKVELLNLKEDPMMKMKRDILVTVYSFLVFTVFAALSFPEVLYRM